MKYLSLCSGIEAASVAWDSLNWNPVAFSEIEKFPCSVLAHHYPNVPNFGDMTKFKEWPDANIDVLVGGTPCQSFSIAGLRKGLDDPRGNLMLTYLGIADRYKPKYIVWENVPGVLSSNGGRDFGTFLQGLAQLGYGFAYRVLDAQFGRTHEHPRAVPQRRRRVFVVGCIGDWRSAAAVLFDSESLRGNPPPSRKKGEEVAGTIGARTCVSIGAQDAMNGHILPVTFDRQSSGEYGTAQVASTMSRRDYKSPSDLIGCIALAGNIIGRAPENGGNGLGYDETGSSYTLTKTGVHAVAYRTNAAGQVNAQGDIAACVNTFSDPTAQFLLQQRRVRRLTPLECERLMGYPDEYTNIPGASNNARYKALGNSMAVNCMRILGERIAMVNKIDALEVWLS